MAEVVLMDENFKQRLRELDVEYLHIIRLVRLKRCIYVHKQNVEHAVGAIFVFGCCCMQNLVSQRTHQTTKNRKNGLLF